MFAVIYHKATENYTSIKIPVFIVSFQQLDCDTLVLFFLVFSFLYFNFCFLFCILISHFLILKATLWFIYLSIYLFTSRVLFTFLPSNFIVIQLQFSTLSPHPSLTPSPPHLPLWPQGNVFLSIFLWGVHWTFLICKLCSA